MRILVVHNHYGSGAVGGEMIVAQQEVNLLRSHGHEVMLYERRNSEFYSLPLRQRFKRMLELSWSGTAQKEILAVLKEFRPDVMHVHNYKFMLTPSIFATAKEQGVTTVMTVHNYRLMVPCALYLNDKLQPCEKCEDGHYCRFLFHHCAGMNLKHRLVSLLSFYGGLREQRLSRIIDGYIALSRFAAKKCISVGIPEKQIFIKPNYIEEQYPDLSENSIANREGGIFIGRLSAEKGIEFLLQNCCNTGTKVTVVGTGPLENTLRKKYMRRNIIFEGTASHKRCLELLRQHRYLLFPSTWVEGLPLTIIEALACGVPCIASNLGARAEIITHGKNGYLYCYNNGAELNEYVQRTEALSVADYSAMCHNAYSSYQEKFSSENNYEQLLKIYQSCIENNKGA